MPNIATINGNVVSDSGSDLSLYLTGSGTLNYLAKYTASGALGNSLVFDNGTNVGIGTASPSQGLTVVSGFADIRFGSGFSAATPTINLINTSSGSAKASAFFAGTNYTGFIFDNSGTFRIASAAKSIFTNNQVANNSETYTMTFFGSSQNVLIGSGTTDAGYRLDVSGTFRSTGDANINGLTVGKGNSGVASNTAFGGGALSANTTGTINTAIGFAALRDNLIGFQNTAVGNAAGRANTGNNNTYLGFAAGIVNTTGSDNTIIGTYSGYALNGGSLNTLLGWFVGGDIVGGGGNTIIGYNTGRGITTGNNNTIIGAGVTGLSSSLSNTIILADGQGNQRLYIDNLGDVGIGTTNPTSATGYTILSINNATNGGAIDLMRNGATQLQFFTSGQQNAIYGGTNLPMRFSTNATERMVISGAGNIGIGIASPSFDLDLTKTSGNGGNVTSNVRNLQSVGESVFRVANDLNHSLILDVFGSGWGSGLANTAMIASSSSLTNLAFVTLGSAGMSFRTNSTGTTNERMTLTAAGRLLIGTTTESTYLLDVNGTARVQGVLTVGTTSAQSIVEMVGSSAGGAGIRFKDNITNRGLLASESWVQGSSLTGFAVYAYSGNPLYFYTGGVKRATIDDGGSMGIGTSSPNASALLDVSSTTKGFLPPRMTGLNAEAIGTPAAGLLVYINNGNGTTITSTGWWGYDGTTWVKLN